MATQFARPAPRRWLRSLLALALIAGAFTVYYVNIKHTRDLNTFDRLVIAVSAPVQTAFTNLYLRGAEFWQGYLALVNVAQENRSLRDQVVHLEARLHTLREVDLENRRLRAMLELTPQHGYPFRTARVVGYDPTSHYRTIRLDRGTEGGLHKGMPVVTSKGVVGRVFRAWEHYADVLLITDTQSGLDCLVQRTRARGTVEGVGVEALQMKYLLRMDEVQEGDVVITSGFDSVFPRGLLVGTVTHLRKQSSGVFQEVQILPAVDLTRLEEVAILEPPPPPVGDPVDPPIIPRRRP